MTKLQRLLRQQPETCMLYFTPNGVNMHDVSDASGQLEPTRSIDTANYGGVTDCGDY